MKRWPVFRSPSEAASYGAGQSAEIRFVNDRCQRTAINYDIMRLEWIGTNAVSFLEM